MIEVPDDLYGTLKARAAEAGISLDDYLIDVPLIADKPTPEELIDRMKRREKVILGSLAAAESVREGREEREADIASWFDDRR